MQARDSVDHARRFERDRLRNDAPLRASAMVAIGLGAMLLFLVQFMIGKRILPWFGGAPAVWTACMLFFQVGLLGGYLYAHLLATRLSPGRQRVVHLGLLAAALTLLAGRALFGSSPLLPGDALRPQAGEAPLPQLLLLLFTTVGLPYFVLSANAPLVQRWLARATPTDSPYRLYALSNAGSMAGLLAYPFLIEPLLPLEAQAWSWAAAFVLYAAACGLVAVLAVRKGPSTETVLPPRASESAVAPGTSESAVASVPAKSATELAAAPRGSARPLLWFALSAETSLLLLAATNHMCQEVAVVPLLWVVPLAIYLLSFVLCFRAGRPPRRLPWTIALVGSALLALTALHWDLDAKVLPVLGVWCFVLLAFCMACHGELARLQPPARDLTRYYLVISAGGATGGLLCSLVAPVVFPATFELHVALFVGVALVVSRVWVRAWPRWVTASGVTLLVAYGGLLGYEAVDSLAGATMVSRNFFGVLRVVHEDQGTDDALVKLKHGRITHGLQFTAAKWRRDASTYYTDRSGVGLALLHHPRRRQGGGPLRVGVVGLGTGTLASYARPGDKFRFYEIDPAVVALSVGSKPVFTFLADAPDRPSVVLGDARLSLEREPAQGFHILAVDAFSSDAVPAHLLTREALLVYLRHLAPEDGILALHISNKTIDLEPVTAGLVGALDLPACVVSTEGEDEHWASTWALLAQRREVLEAPELRKACQPLRPERPPVLWTDDRNDLARLIKW